MAMLEHQGKGQRLYMKRRLLRKFTQVGSSRPYWLLIKMSRAQDMVLLIFPFVVQVFVS